MILLFFISLAPNDVHTVDRIEFNHYTYGTACLDQLILWNLDDWGLHADFWCPLECVSKPRYDGKYWHITIQRRGKAVRIRSREFIETESNYDPERRDVYAFPLELRKWK